MLSFLRRRWLAVGIALVVIGGVIALTAVYLRPAKTHHEATLPVAPQAPPDLEKLRNTYASGVEAVHRGDGGDAVKHLASFDFGSRGVEEYRLYYLAQAYQLAGNGDSARATLAQLWHRNPKLVVAPDVAFNLGAVYAGLGDWTNAADVYATLAVRATDPSIAAAARWNAVQMRVNEGDVSGALAIARHIVIRNPISNQADDAIAFMRALTGVPADQPVRLTPEERLERATNLIRDGDPQHAFDELTLLDPVAPGSIKQYVQLQRGVALSALRRYEDSNKLLEPLTSSYYKVAVPALYTASRNYAVLSASINPIVVKTVKQKKQVGTIKQRIGKGKKKKLVTKPKFAVVATQVKLVDLAKKNKKDEYDRLTSERLKDLLQLPIENPMRLEVLNTLIARAEPKNQDEYLQQLVPQVVKLDATADPALQHFWDKAWAAYARGDLNGAKPLFRFIGDTYVSPGVRRQADYWYARTIERLGAKEEAMAIYTRIASSPYRDIYAMNAEARGAPKRDEKTNPLDAKRPDWRDIAEKQMPAELRLAYELTALEQFRDAWQEIRANMRLSNQRFASALAADYYNSAGATQLKYRSLKAAWPQLATADQDSTPEYFLRMYYPVRYEDSIRKYAKKNGLDPYLVMALIHQESYYDPHVKSPVGATGLMQLMPATAKELASRMHVPFGASRLETPEVNIELGTAHLKMLINMFGGKTELAVASYNAGQGNVLKWRRAAPGKPMDEFLESIPFPETRTYVKRVTMIRATYERITE